MDYFTRMKGASFFTVEEKKVDVIEEALKVLEKLHFNPASPKVAK